MYKVKITSMGNQMFLPSVFTSQREALVVAAEYVQMYPNVSYELVAYTAP